MHLDKIQSIYNFNKDVVRNTPVVREKEDVLSDLVDDQFDINVAKKTIGKKRDAYFQEIEHHSF